MRFLILFLIINQTISILILKEGDSVRLNCGIFEDFNTVTWSRKNNYPLYIFLIYKNTSRLNTANLASNNQFSSSSNFDLLISNLTLKNSDIYNCKTDTGKNNSIEIKVIKQSKDKINEKIEISITTIFLLLFILNLFIFISTLTCIFIKIFYINNDAKNLNTLLPFQCNLA